MLIWDMTAMIIKKLEPRYTEINARDIPGTFVSQFNSYRNPIRKKIFTHCTDVKNEVWRHHLTFPGQQ